MISLFFCSEHLNLVISIWLIMIIIVILIEIKNFEEFNSEYILQRDQEINELLKKKKLNSDNINNMIDYFTLEMELDSVVYKESEFLNGISNAGSKIIFLLLGAFIPELIKKNFFSGYLSRFNFILSSFSRNYNCKYSYYFISQIICLF